MGATVENGADTPVLDQDLEVAALDAARDEEGDYMERLEAERAEADRREMERAAVPQGEKVPQTVTLKLSGVQGDGAPPDLKRGEYLYFEGVAKVKAATVTDKLDGETFVTLEAVKVVTAQMTDFRFERGWNGPELDPDQQSLGLS